MESMTTTNDFDLLEDVVAKAHDICDSLLLFETVCVGEQELRLVLERFGVSDSHLQDQYLSLAGEYRRYTGGD